MDKIANTVIAQQLTKPHKRTLPPPLPAIPRRQCQHCGTPFPPRTEQEHFCCAGCEAVSTMIEAQGLGHFYDLRKGISTPARPLEPRDFSWLQTLAMQAETDARMADEDTARLALPLTGIHCMGCRWLISELFTQQPAHGVCELDEEGSHIRFSWQLPEEETAAHSFNSVVFADALLAFGYALENPALPRPADTAKTQSQQSPRKRLAPRLLLCGIFALNAIIFSLPVRLGVTAEDFPLLRLFSLVVLLCATLSIALAASYFWRRPRFDATGAASKRPQSNPPGSSAAPDARAPQDFANKAGFPPRRVIAILLLVLWVLVLIAPNIGLPPVFTADAAAATGFAALLIAFGLKR